MDSVAERNYKELKSKSYEVKFELADTLYDPIENIGSGAYGVVCSAVHRATKERVAIKKISSIFEQSTIAKRTYREIKILKHFNHDNVIAIRNIIRPKEPVDDFKDVYIVFDLMESDLSRIIHSRQEITDEHVQYFLYQIMRGLKYVHSANVLHRDLKPSNLFVNENCELKIGDFGMARGVSSAHDNYNYNMTQYVATRWYRAPELMLLPLEYTGAVDVWSAGCIFAEMLSRKHLFKGQNNVDQLKRIIDVLGVPSEDFLRITRSHLKSFIKGLGAKKAAAMETLFPQATSNAHDLLSKMLVIDPRYRISVDDTLQHPYLSRYHDPLDEPVCVPVFDFQFEKEELTPDKLKEVILNEIREYEATTVIKKPVFDLRPVNKKSSTARATGLQAFLLQQQQQVKKEQPQKSIDVSKCVKPVKLESAAADVEMLSGKLLEMGLHETKDNEKETRLYASTVDHVPDVDMLSAKHERTANEEHITVKHNLITNEGNELNVPLDSKALIKAAILKGELRRKQADGNENKETSRTVTAVQRQREREEKRRKRQKKMNRNRGNLRNANTLTDEDRSMLARWKSMQQQQATVLSAEPIRHLATEQQTTVLSAGPIRHLTTEQPDRSCSANPKCLLQSNEHTNDAEKTLVASSIASDVTCPESCSRVWMAEGSTSQLSPWLPTYTEAMQARQQATYSQQSLEASTAHCSINDMMYETGDLSAICNGEISILRHHPQQKQQQEQEELTSKTCFTDLSDNCTQFASLNALTKQIMKSHMDDLTLEHSPKVSNNSYGLGSNIEALLANQENTSDSRLDSAPLSASLIADWLELSGNLDINDDALQRELEMSPTVMPNLLI